MSAAEILAYVLVVAGGIAWAWPVCRDTLKDRREIDAREAMQERAALIYLRPRSGNVEHVAPIRRPKSLDR